jgi:predicted AlkP superfamily phosphohydrolase/phosphomutase
MRPRTFLIGLDGATFDVLDPLMADGVMPNLSAFLSGGVRAPLRTVIPALTPPAWTSLMTGCKPGNHGVFDFFRMDPETRHIRFFSSRDVGQPTLWSLAADAGLTVTSLNFPAMFPAPKIAGAIVPGWIPWRQLRISCWPENLFERLKELPGFNPRELAMDMDLEEKATEGCADRTQYAPWINLHIRRERNWASLLHHLFLETQSDLTAVVFDGVDKLQHLCWRFLQPLSGVSLLDEWELEIRQLCLDYFRQLDILIAELVHLAGPQAHVFLASDHGFGPTDVVFHANAWLAERRYLAWSDAGRGESGDGSLLGVGRVARHTWTLDWSKTKAFVATPTSNGIFICVGSDGDRPGIRPEEYEGFRERLANELLQVRDPKSGEGVVAEVWTREQVFSGAHAEYAPDLTLVLHDGGLVSILPSESAVGYRSEVAGAHRPVGIFAAKGPGIRSGMRLPEMSILDVAPTILRTLALPVPGGMDGKVAEDIFLPEFLSENTPHQPETSTPAMAEFSSATLSQEDELVVMERLRQLGYIE